MLPIFPLLHFQSPENCQQLKFGSQIRSSKELHEVEPAPENARKPNVRDWVWHGARWCLQS